MNAMDEPVLGLQFDDGGAGQEVDENIMKGIRRLVEDQPFGVLCTQGGGQPYGSLLAYAYTEDLKHLYFTTSVATRKFRLLKECGRAAMLIDNRSRHPDSLMDVEALTVTGRALHVKEGDALEEGIAFLIRRHAYLKTFVRCRTTALFRFDAIRYLYVTRFQEVRQWVP